MEMKQKWGVAFAGLTVGLVAVCLGIFGNPANMAFCIACFIRDTAGALGLHRAEAVQYIRPEIIGIVLGAFIIGLIKKDYSNRLQALNFENHPLPPYRFGKKSIISWLAFCSRPSLESSGRQVHPRVLNPWQ